MSGRWRVGVKQPKLVFEGDLLVGEMETPERAAQVVAAVNGAPEELRFCVCEPFPHGSGPEQECPVHGAPGRCAGCGVPFWSCHGLRESGVACCESCVGNPLGVLHTGYEP